MKLIMNIMSLKEKHGHYANVEVGATLWLQSKKFKFCMTADLRKTQAADEISGSHGSKYENDWDVAPCSLVEIYQCFRKTYCLHHQGCK
jgi:hypothetical protein